MTLSNELQTFLTVLLAAFIPAIPIAAGVFITWLKARQNQEVLQTQPSKDDVETLIANRLAVLPNSGKDIVYDSGSGDRSSEANAGTGASGSRS